VKVSARNIVKKLKDKHELEAKTNFTFRLTIEMMKKFKEKCDKNDVSMASVIEELINGFNGE
jgi:hypothetical protein